MSSYKDLAIYNRAYKVAIRIHMASLKLPKFEIHEQGSQIRRSSKSIKDNIVEGYGRRRYKAEFIQQVTSNQHLAKYRKTLFLCLTPDACHPMPLILFLKFTIIKTS
jgi:hypothetical protein